MIASKNYIGIKIPSILILIIILVSCNQTNGSVSIDEIRSEINFNRNWSFSVDSFDVGVKNKWYEKGIPLGLKREVQIPHTWNIEKGLEQYFGSAWYEKEFEVPASWEDKLLRLKFGAIHRNATIYINGKLVKDHFGAGYTTFYVDITNAVKIGTTNKLMVLCDNKFTKNSIPYDLAFDWANDGGIHRDVSILATNKRAIDYVHISPEYYRNKNQFDGSLFLKVKLLKSVNEGDNDLNLLVHIQEENQSTNHVVFSEPVRLKFEDGFYTGSVLLENIKTWHFDAPNLYQVQFGLIDGNIQIDDYTTTTGFKKFEVRNGEFYLNDELVRLPGIEWMPGSNPALGFAEDTTEIYKMLSLMKEANSVITRFHWQQDEKVINWCNRNGILVQQELPHWQKPNELSDSVQTSINLQIEEMITRDFNAPSIYSWGIGNELNGQSVAVNDFLMNSRRLIHEQFDSTRLISYTSNTVHKDPAKDAARVGDFIMWNDYQGTWHSNITDSIGVMLDQINHDFPEKPIMIAEFGLCEPQFSGGDKRRIADMYTHIDYYLARPFVSGAIYFSLNDYRTHKGEAGKGLLKQRVHGITDLEGNKKPSFEQLKELWSPLKLAVVEENNNKLILEITCESAMPAYTIKGYSLEAATNNKVLSEIDLPDLVPGQKITIEIHKAGLIRIKRPGNFICSEIQLDKLEKP